jgi:hypothetical protein
MYELKTTHTIAKYISSAILETKSSTHQEGEQKVEFFILNECDNYCKSCHCFKNTDD